MQPRFAQHSKELRLPLLGSCRLPPLLHHLLSKVLQPQQTDIAPAALCHHTTLLHWSPFRLAGAHMPQPMQLPATRCDSPRIDLDQRLRKINPAMAGENEQRSEQEQ